MEEEKSLILIADDEEDILEFLSYNLTQEGYEVASVQNGADAIAFAVEHIPDLIIMDVSMQGKDGIETCAEMRRIPKLNDTLIAFLTARSENYSEIAGLEAGADDYIVKPIKIRVLKKRIKALLKRKNKNAVTQSLLTVSDIKIDLEQFLVYKGEEEIQLPKKEFELLVFMAQKAGRVFTRKEIYSAIWGSDVIVGERTIDVHIKRLRNKLGAKLIKTIKGVGYKIEN